MEENNTNNVEAVVETPVTEVPATESVQETTPVVETEPVQTTTEPTVAPVQPLPVEPVRVQEVPSESNNSNKPKKGNKIIVILLTLILLVAVGYVVYDKFIADKPEEEISENSDVNNENVENNDTNNENGQNNGSTNQPVENDCITNGCTFSNGSFNFEIKVSDTTTALYINGNKAVEDERLWFYNESILVLNDIAVVRMSDNQDHFTTFRIYDTTGKELLNATTLDPKYGNSMILDGLNESRPALYLEGNKIKINASRFTHGPAILGENNGNVINKDTSCDTVVMGTYEIEYLGNGKLSEIKNTSYITLRDAINNHGYNDLSNYVTCN